MSQDELDELFGEEISEGSPMEEEELAVSKLTDSEGEALNSEGEEEEEDEIVDTNVPADINELTLPLPSVQTPSNQGLIVKTKFSFLNFSFFVALSAEITRIYWM